MTETSFCDLFTQCYINGHHEWVEITSIEPRTYLYIVIEKCSECNKKVYHCRYKYMNMGDEYVD